MKEAQSAGHEAAIERVRQQYNSTRILYERLAINLQQALVHFLEEGQIAYLAVSARVKALDSIEEKIERKRYVNPFEECEDLCGLRVICYYPSDVEKIAKIIKDEFNVKESIDKAANLGVHEFGYRSTHFIVTVKERWLAAPNYRGLKGIKAEIQVRTILMHAWAEIEHKLAYKRVEDVPAAFIRKLSRLSAKFEEADEQFEDLRTGLQQYREALAQDAEKTGRFDARQPLNLDSLTAFLQFYFPDRSESTPDGVRSLLEEITSQGLTMKQLVEHAETVVKKVDEYESMRRRLKPNIRWNQVGALRSVLDIGVPGYRNARLREELKNIEFNDRIEAMIEEIRRSLAPPSGSKGRSN